MTDKKWNTILKLIDEFEENQRVLASQIGIGRSAFCLKISDKYPDKFSEEQKEKIADYLLKKSKAIVKALKK